MEAFEWAGEPADWRSETRIHLTVAILPG